MILGVGIDLCEIDRMTKLLTHPKFIERVLTMAERQQLQLSHTTKRQAEFLAGRFACKEAYSKACKTGIGPVSFQDLEILNDENGAPYFSKHPLKNIKTHVSISHTADVASAVVLLEE